MLRDYKFDQLHELQNYFFHRIVYALLYISKFTYARNFTGQPRHTGVVKRYEYLKTQQFRCIGVTKRFEYLKNKNYFLQ